MLTRGLEPICGFAPTAAFPTAAFPVSAFRPTWATLPVDDPQFLIASAIVVVVLWAALRPHRWFRGRAEKSGCQSCK